ncbi:hypothetical protein ACFSTC_51945 [Nonomuraea ferruginea]
MHSVTGPAPLAVMWAMLAALDHVFFRLRPMENSSLSTFALSMSVASIAVIILVSVPPVPHRSGTAGTAAPGHPPGTGRQDPGAGRVPRRGAGRA